MVTDLTGMAVANASLLDEAHRRWRSDDAVSPRPGQKARRRRRRVSRVGRHVFRRRIEVLRSRAEPIGIELRIGPTDQMTFDARVFGALVQYPDEAGRITDLRGFISRAQAAGALVAVATDLLALAADYAARRNGRRRGLRQLAALRRARSASAGLTPRSSPRKTITCATCPAGSSACPLTRRASPRIAWRCRRANSTSGARRRRRNICTAQALLANMAAMYAGLSRPRGHPCDRRTCPRSGAAPRRGTARAWLQQENDAYFDTLRITATADALKTIRGKAVAAGLNFRYAGDSAVSIALDETATLQDVQRDCRRVCVRGGPPTRTGARRVGARRRTRWCPSRFAAPRRI